MQRARGFGLKYLPAGLLGTETTMRPRTGEVISRVTSDRRTRRQVRTHLVDKPDLGVVLPPNKHVIQAGAGWGFQKGVDPR